MLWPRFFSFAGAGVFMKITTWNINSVRLRIDTVTAFLKREAPDVLCLQEIKCLEDNFPAKAFRAAGYEHQAVSGQSGYHGVAIVSKSPLKNVERRAFCEKGDCRHIAASVAGGVRIHNFYVPAGGDEPDVKKNPKFQHKLDFLDEMTAWFGELGPRAKRCAARTRCLVAQAALESRIAHAGGGRKARPGG